MTDPVFLLAYETVRRSCSDEVWTGLSARQITQAIYQEMRRIDVTAARNGRIARTAPTAEGS